MTVQEIPEEEREGEDPLLWMIKQISEDKIRFVWPCIVSIIVKAELFDIIPDKEVVEISQKLDSATPKTFNTILNYHEKVKILLHLINSCHDLNAFREYISNRLKEKNKYSREKQETYNEIRQQEQEKRKRMEQHSKSDFVTNDGVQNEIVVLEEELKNASRTQGKLIRDKLINLNKDKDNFRKIIGKIDENISSLEEKIRKLNDQIWKVSLKVSVIGHDLENEYWYFKDDPSKVYIKEFKTNTWRYYSDEESVIELEESLITKGIRERKLYENLRKLKGKLKLKRRKDLKAEEKGKIDSSEKSHDEAHNGSEPHEESKDAVMVEEVKVTETNNGEIHELPQDVEMKGQTDQIDMEITENSDIEDIDWDKHLERAIQYSLKKSEISTRRSGRNRTKKLDTLSIECIVEKLLENEEEYTEAAAELNKAWGPISTREEIKKALLDNPDEETIAKCVQVMEDGYSNPMNYKLLSQVDLNQMEVEEDSKSNKSGENYVMNDKKVDGEFVFYRNNRKIKKFWSSDALKGKLNLSNYR